MDLPSHPDADDTTAGLTGTDRYRSRAATIALWTVAAIVVVVIVLHLTGVVGPLAD